MNEDSKWLVFGALSGIVPTLLVWVDGSISFDQAGRIVLIWILWMALVWSAFKLKDLLRAMFKDFIRKVLKKE